MPAKHYLYGTWAAMLNRCYREESINFEDYGGRGIRVHDRWHEFDAWFEDMGDRPQGLTLDRIDFDGDYEPGNCRWADAETQNNNKSNTQFITCECTGETLSHAQWSRRLGPSRILVNSRLNKGWDPQKAISVPARPKKPKGANRASSATV